MTIRDDLVKEVREYLVGPRSEDEIIPAIPNFPLDYYISGVLLPKNSELESQDTESLDTDRGKDNENENFSDQAPGMFKQNSIGLRVDLNSQVDAVLIEIDYGKYRLNRESRSWKRERVQKDKREFKINLNKKSDKIEILNPDDGLLDSTITWNVDERKSSDSFKVLTVFLENSRDFRKYDREKNDFDEARIDNNQNSIFQPLIRIKSDSKACPFRNQEISLEGGFQTSEDKILDTMYRKTKVFGVGYNCAANWDNQTNPLEVHSEIIPSYTAKAIAKYSEGRNDKRPWKVDMYDLAYSENDDLEKYRDKIKESLGPLVENYDEWITSLGDEISKIKEKYPQDYEMAAKENQDRCRNAHSRMDEGLKLLLNEKTSKEVLLAFLLANRAMLYQRTHYDYALRRFKSKSSSLSKPNPKQAGKEFWYPFQIAFFLMSLKGIVDKTSSDREIVDLLWFPTGGGKTEAYLGVAAFAIILRRLRGDAQMADGVSVIMRYTLRLLTLQQFERAATLMCALEFIRRSSPHYGLGKWPFLVGLWVGWTLTPNSWQQSADSLKSLKDDYNADTSEGSPVQLFFCPWCGHGITPRNFDIDPTTHWTVCHCSSKDCFFNIPKNTEKGLPVVTVDTDIYRRCPSLIIATVDKFARMPYRPEISAIFGKFEKFCEQDGFLTHNDDCGASIRHAKSGKKILHVEEADGPDLIIQDELHLITGPLGTSVGLYETAVDYLTRRESKELVIRPKIIVSTATIRGVDDQVRKLFNRHLVQKFPPPGINHNDSYFWWESEKDGRQYVGVSFSNFSAKFALARLFACLLQKVKQLSGDYSPKEIDPYWTLVCYFNSIRELGGSIRLVEDDVVKNIGDITSLIQEYKNSERRDPGKPHEGLEELTGRITQKGIRNIRERLEKPHSDREAINTLLATNMISVGIDVERLGLMVVVGQTKNSSEYIQATGRIGRREDIPGLVFSFFNPYKPRDLSHYENFIGYHMKMQKSVESSTLTPFSVRALERALHAVFISMVRLSIPRLSGKESANDFEDADGREIRNFILERLSSIEQVDKKSTEYIDLRQKINDLMENWKKYIVEAKVNPNGVWYNNPYRPKMYGDADENKHILMIEYAKKSDESKESFPIATPESLRNVEKDIKLEYK